MEPEDAAEQHRRRGGWAVPPTNSVGAITPGLESPDTQIRHRFRRCQGPPAVDTARAVSDRAGDRREKAERSPLRPLPSSPRVAVCRCRVNTIAAAPAIVRLTDARSRQRHHRRSSLSSNGVAFESRRRQRGRLKDDFDSTVYIFLKKVEY